MRADRSGRSGPLLNFISREILPGGGRMKEAIHDCPAISYFDRYPVIRSFATTALGGRRRRKKRKKGTEKEKEGRDSEKEGKKI